MKLEGRVRREKGNEEGRLEVETRGKQRAERRERLTVQLRDQILEDTLEIPPIRIKAPLDDGIGEHLVLGGFRWEFEREDGDVNVDGDVFVADLVSIGGVGPEIEVVKESSFDAVRGRSRETGEFEEERPRRVRKLRRRGTRRRKRMARRGRNDSLI